MTGLGSEWPTAQLHGAELVSLLAKSAPGLCLVERVIDAPAVEAWSWLADLEQSIPAFDRTVRQVDIVERRAPLVTSGCGQSGCRRCDSDATWDPNTGS